MTSGARVVRHARRGRGRDFRACGGTTSGGRWKSLSAVLFRGIPGTAEGGATRGTGRGRRRGLAALWGVGAVGLSDEEGPWPATGPGSSSGSAAAARSRAGGCDGPRVGVRGQRSGGASAPRGLREESGVRRGDQGSGGGLPRVPGGADRGVWEMAVAARRSGAGGERVCPETGRLTSAETLRPAGLHVGETSLRSREESVGRGKWPGGCPRGAGELLQGGVVAWTHSVGLLASCGFCCFCPGLGKVL